MFTVFALALDCAGAQSFTSQIFRAYGRLALLYYGEVFQVEVRTAPNRMVRNFQRSQFFKACFRLFLATSSNCRFNLP